MYNNSGMNKHCGNNCNKNTQTCNMNCQGDSITVDALYTMQKDLAVASDLRGDLLTYGNMLDEAVGVSKELAKTATFYGTFEIGVEQYIQGNDKYDTAYKVMLQAIKCCQTSSTLVSTDCSKYTQNIQTLIQQVYTNNATLATKSADLKAAIIATGTSTGTLTNDITQLASPLRLAYLATQEELEYQSKSYTLKVNGFECCTNNHGGCSSVCACYDPSKPLCQCDELMRLSQEKRMQAEDITNDKTNLETLVKTRSDKLLQDLNTGRDTNNKLYDTMTQMMNLYKNNTLIYSQILEQCKLAYNCCSDSKNQCQSSGNTYTGYLDNNYVYNEYGTCAQPYCPVNCDTIVANAKTLVTEGDTLIASGSQKFTSTSTTIASRQTLEAQNLLLYKEALDGISKVFTQLDVVSKDIYQNVLCNLDNAYRCCRAQH